MVSGPDLAALADQVRRCSDQVSELRLEFAEHLPVLQERQTRAREDFTRHQEGFGARLGVVEEVARGLERRTAVLEDGVSQASEQLKVVVGQLDAVRMRSAYLLGAIAASGAAGGGVAAAVQWLVGGP